MTDGQLHTQLLIISVLFQCSTSAESASCSTCMADIQGPYVENQPRPLNSVEMVRVTESNPTVIVCRYTCCDTGYDFKLKIDILDPCAPPQRLRSEPIFGTQEYQDSIHDFRVVPLTNSASVNIGQTCDQENSETRRYRIYVRSPDVPTLIAKCFVKHFPNFPSSENSSECSSSSTLAIVSGYSTPDSSTCVTPSTTVINMSSSSLPSTLKTVTVTVTVSGSIDDALVNNDTICTNNNVQYCNIVCGSLFAGLAVVMLILFIVMLILSRSHTKCTPRKSQHTSTHDQASTPEPQIRPAWTSSNSTSTSGSQLRPRTA